MEISVQAVLSKPLIKVSEYAEIVDQSPDHVWREIRNGKLHAIRLPGGAIRIQGHVVRAILSGAEQEEKEPEEAPISC